MIVNIKKKTRVRVQRIVAQPIGTHSLSGMRMKVAATMEDFIGTVTHVYADHPTAPTQYVMIVAKDEGGAEVEVKPEHITEIVDAAWIKEPSQ